MKKLYRSDIVGKRIVTIRQTPYACDEGSEIMVSSLYFTLDSGVTLSLATGDPYVAFPPPLEDAIPSHEALTKLVNDDFFEITKGMVILEVLAPEHFPFACFLLENGYIIFCGPALPMAMGPSYCTINTQEMLSNYYCDPCEFVTYWGRQPIAWPYVGQ